MSPLEAVVLFLVAPTIIGGMILYWLIRTIRQRQQAVKERFPTAVAYLPNVNFFGQESKGRAQMRGNGTLVLTQSEIYFARWIPLAEYTIPLAKIQSVETVNGFLGKTVFRPLLKVVYQNEAGKTDAIAWLVPDLDGLKKMIEDRIK